MHVCHTFQTVFTILILFKRKLLTIILLTWRLCHISIFTQTCMKSRIPICKTNKTKRSKVAPKGEGAHPLRTRPKASARPGQQDGCLKKCNIPIRKASKNNSSSLQKDLNMERSASNPTASVVIKDSKTPDGRSSSRHKRNDNKHNPPARRTTHNDDNEVKSTTTKKGLVS